MKGKIDPNFSQEAQDAVDRAVAQATTYREQANLFCERMVKEQARGDAWRRVALELAEDLAGEEAALDA